MADADLDPFRVCVKCQVSKPATTEHFDRAKWGKARLQSYCKACSRSDFKRRYNEDTEFRGRINEQSRVKRAQEIAAREPFGPPVPAEFRICRGCFRMLPCDLSNFSPAKRDTRGTSSRCRPCTRAQGRASKKANPEKVRAVSRAYREINKEKSRQWRAKNPERQRDLMRSAIHRRRALEAKAEGSFTADDVAKQLKSQNGKCWWCSKQLDRSHVDHRIPLSKGGTNWPSNLVISCPPCNRSKSARMPWELDNPRLL